ncbi:Protein disulfide-isomerase [Forsythia ovata]|uniref:protein disulfide-isomerase n=1 Tax=Forsythia ovata TaxID=205694 RepID=A0ABD1WZ01_9LAMI
MCGSCSPVVVPVKVAFLDLSGRPHLSYDLHIPTERVDTYNTHLLFNTVSILLSVEFEPISGESQFDWSIAEAQQLEESVVILWYEFRVAILRNGGKNIQEYKGLREADDIVDYLKKQAGLASAEIKSTEDVGVFPKFSGEEFETLSENLRYDYNFGDTLDAKLLPRGESVQKPTLRLLKPFDELFVDFQDFQVVAMEKFIEKASIPVVTIFYNDPSNHPYVKTYSFNSPNAEAMLFVNFSKELDSLQSTYKDVAKQSKGKGISFLFCDLEASEGAFQKFPKANIVPTQIAPWLKDYLDGLMQPFIRSEPVPEVNDEPVKVFVTESLQDMVSTPEGMRLADGAMVGYTPKGMQLAQDTLVNMNSRRFTLNVRMANDLLLAASGEKTGGYTTANLILDMMQALRMTLSLPAVQAYYNGLKVNLLFVLELIMEKS